MNARFEQVKKVTMVLISIPLFFFVLWTPTATTARAAGDDFDAAAVFKAKCAMCHGAKAEKKFDPAKPEEQLIDAVLKGRDGTPKMPSYEKSYNADQAKALVAYMKTLKQ